MDIRLSDLAACFEGVIPSIVATTSADGMPNISYLSHVVRVDDDHVALSNQFFAKTAANVRANPQVALLLVDGLTGEQYALDISFVRSVDVGPLFDRIALQLKASSAQVGMADVMRLKSADVFRVHAVAKVPSPVDAPPPPTRRPVDLAAVSAAAAAIERQEEAGNVIDALLSGVREALGYDHALVMIHDPQSRLLTTVGSIGYARSGLGSEIAAGEGLIGAAAAGGHAIKVNDMSRVSRFGKAIALDTEASENLTRSVPFPQLPDALSQISVPMIARGAVRGVLFVESRERLAFRGEDEAALEILARQAASALLASETEGTASGVVRRAATPPPLSGAEIRIVHHGFDDSVFIDGHYIVKGVAGRLLALMLERHLSEGRCEFSNRELRLLAGPRMPEIKDNMETRLLLLRRRLDEKAAPLRVIHAGRGRVMLKAEGIPVLVSAE